MPNEWCLSWQPNAVFSFHLEFANNYKLWIPERSEGQCTSFYNNFFYLFPIFSSLEFFKPYSIIIFLASIILFEKWRKIFNVDGHTDKKKQTIPERNCIFPTLSSNNLLPIFPYGILVGKTNPLSSRRHR